VNESEYNYGHPTGADYAIHLTIRIYIHIYSKHICEAIALLCRIVDADPEDIWLCSTVLQFRFSC